MLTTAAGLETLRTIKGRCTISGFRCEAENKCAVLGYYAAGSGNFLQTFQDNLSVPSSRVNNPKITTTLCIITHKDVVLNKGTNIYSHIVTKPLYLLDVFP